MDERNDRLKIPGWYQRIQINLQLLSAIENPGFFMSLGKRTAITLNFHNNSLLRHDPGLFGVECTMLVLKSKS